MHTYFSNHAHFSEMDEIQRRKIAGIATTKQTGSDIWGWFGSMRGSIIFQNRINNNNVNISHALDAIPLQGEIYKTNYMEFIYWFKEAFPGGGSGVAIASRLLTMKRPDYFVCIDSRNRRRLCLEFGIPQSISFEGYWDDIIERILESVWWSSERPSDEIELLAWQGRSAMLDALFYEELE